MEIRHPLRIVRNFDYTGCCILQHEVEGRLAYGKYACPRDYCFRCGEPVVCYMTSCPRLYISLKHGDMEQKQREVLMNEFHSGSSRLLIATDLLARGISVQQESLVINYDLPANRENYSKRVCGRPGREAINFVTTEDVRVLRDIESKTFLVQQYYLWLKTLDVRILQHSN